MASGVATRETSITALKPTKILPIRLTLADFYAQYDCVEDGFKYEFNNGIIEKTFNAGVKVFWIISPEFEMVEIYTSPKDVQICTGEDVCSAALVIDGFELTAADVFKK